MPAPTRTPARSRQQDGGYSTVQTLLWAPWLFLLALGGTQAVVYGWGYLAARHAAEQAVQTTRLHGGTATAGQTQARTVLAQAAGNALTDVDVQVTRDGDTAAATIGGAPMRVVPGIPLPRVQVAARAPVERFRAPDGPP